MSDPKNLTELVEFMRKNGVVHFQGHMTMDDYTSQVTLTLHPEAVELYSNTEVSAPPSPDEPRDADGLTRREQEELYGRTFLPHQK